jgi:hypothetical protein
VPGAALVERRVVDAQRTAGFLDEGLGLFPELLGVGFEPVEQPVGRVVGGCEGGVRLHACGLRTTDRAWGGDEEIDVVFGGIAWGVHRRIVEQVNVLTNCTYVV